MKTITASPSNETTIVDSILTIEEIAKYQNQRDERFIVFEKCVITGEVSELKLQKARFIDCDILQVNIDKCDLDKLYFSNCAISSTDIKSGRMKEINIDKSTLRESYFIHTQMEAISIEESSLYDVSCSHCPSICHIRVFESKLFKVNLDFINQLKHIEFYQNTIDDCNAIAILKIENFRVTKNVFTDSLFVPLKLYFFHPISLHSKINRESPMAKVNSNNAEGAIINNTILHSRIEFAAFINTFIHGNIFVDDCITNCSFLQTRTFYNNTFLKTNFQSFFHERVVRFNSGLEQRCPEEGSFIAFKKVLCEDNGPNPIEPYATIFGWKETHSCIVKLLIPEDAMRSSALSPKCRANKAKVLGFYDLNRNELNIKEACSSFDHNFKYKVGETVEVKNFDTNRWNECAAGIHFFLSFDTAANYRL